MSLVRSDKARRLLQAVLDSPDEEALTQRARALVGGGAAPAGRDSGVSESAKELERRFSMADILDDSILQARSGDTTFPLRLFFSELVTRAHDDNAFALACGVNSYFRIGMNEESKIALGVEVSKLYYRFAPTLDAQHVRALSPLLAQLMSTELERVVLESVDGDTVFDSAKHERAPEADQTSRRIRAPQSFLCRVGSNERPRFKALVVTG